MTLPVPCRVPGLCLSGQARLGTAGCSRRGCARCQGQARAPPCPLSHSRRQVGPQTGALSCRGARAALSQHPCAGCGSQLRHGCVRCCRCPPTVVGCLRAQVFQRCRAEQGAHAGAATAAVTGHAWDACLPPSPACPLPAPQPAATAFPDSPGPGVLQDPQAGDVPQRGSSGAPGPLCVAEWRGQSR